MLSSRRLSSARAVLMPGAAPPRLHPLRSSTFAAHGVFSTLRGSHLRTVSFRVLSHGAKGSNPAGVHSGATRQKARPIGGPIAPSRTVHSAPKEYRNMVPKNIQVLASKLVGMGINTDYKVVDCYQRTLCPKCEGGSSGERSLAVNLCRDGSRAHWRCFRATCGWTGSTKLSDDANQFVSAKGLDADRKEDNQEDLHLFSSFGDANSMKSNSVARNLRNKDVKKNKGFIEEELQLMQLEEVLIKYFAARGISQETLRRNQVMQRFKDPAAIAFTYRRNGVLVGCKYRHLEKKFWQETGSENIFYGLDDIENAQKIIIVEGEMDKLSLEEAGYRNCVSVPNGAPVRVADVDPLKEMDTMFKYLEDTKFKYLQNCEEYLKSASEIILATDGDGPGQALAEELARRLGKERCWRVKWPMKNPNEPCKDANEVLMYLGKEELKYVIENAELYPIKGLFRFMDFYHEIDKYYFGGDKQYGMSTGWRGLDDLYKVVPGELTIVTGVPNSGKSEWIDSLLCNLYKQAGWKFVMCSMENKVTEHARKLLEKHIGKPFFDARYADSVRRMSPEELEAGKDWLNKTFHLIRCEEDSLPSVDWVLKLAKIAVFRFGVCGLVIDPYNELDHQRQDQSETEYVSQILTKIKRFAQHHSCHVWFVAHPRQLQNWNGGPPNMYDISGSAHFINKCDNGIVIHRVKSLKSSNTTDYVLVGVRKVRNKVVGKIGNAFLSYNRITGEYADVNEAVHNELVEQLNRSASNQAT